MKIFVSTLLVLGLATSAFAGVCIQNSIVTGVFTVNANEAVGQYVDAQYITQNIFRGAALYRADSTPVSGTFYILPGQNTLTLTAVFSAPFFSTSQQIYANGSFLLPPALGYTFLWVRDGTGNATDIYQADNWLAAPTSLAFVGGQFVDPDNAIQLCFDHLNNAPTHSILSNTFNATNTLTIATGQLTMRANRGGIRPGTYLNLNMNDIDAGYVTFNISVTTIGTTAVQAYLSANMADAVGCEIVTWNTNEIAIRGPLANIQSTISVFYVRWGTSWESTSGGVCTFRLTTTVTDAGNSGVCPFDIASGAPCTLYTSSRVEIKTS